MEFRLLTALTEEFAAQRDRLFLWAPVFFALGTGVYFSLPFEHPVWPVVPGAAAMLSLYILSRPWPKVSPFVLLAFLFVAGFLAAQVRTYSLYTPVLHKDIGPVDVTGTIAAVEELPEGKGRRIMLDHLTIEHLAPKETPAQVRLTTRRAENYAPGQRVELLAQLSGPSPPVAPGAFDFQRYMYFEGIGGVGFIYKTIRISGAPVEDATDFFEDLRQVIAARMRPVMSPANAPLAIALTNGERAAISEDDNLAMRNSGLSHLISISGLHIGVFSALVFFAVRLGLALVPGLALKYPIKKAAAVLAFCAAAFYSLLAGLSIPTERSLIMIGVIYMAIILDRSPISLRLVAFAALAVLSGAPESLISVSFQMSFAAVAALVWFYESTREYWQARTGPRGIVSRAGMYVAGICLTTVIATAATAPFSLAQFQQLALYGVASNAVAIPLSSFVTMPAIVLSLLLMPFHAEFYAVKVLEVSVAGILRVAHYVSDLPDSVLYMAAWPGAALPLMTGGVVFLCLWRGHLRWLGLLPVLCSFVMIATFRQPDILIAPDFDVMGYRAANGDLFVSGKRKGQFAIQSWEKLGGLVPGSAKAWPKEGQAGNIACDEKACRLEMRGHKVAFLKKPMAMAEECAWAEMVIAFNVTERVPCAAQILDRRDGFKHGAYALWLEPQGIVIQSAAQARGKRPWSE